MQKYIYNVVKFNVLQKNIYKVHILHDNWMFLFAHYNFDIALVW